MPDGHHKADNGLIIWSATCFAFGRTCEFKINNYDDYELKSDGTADTTTIEIRSVRSDFAWVGIERVLHKAVQVA